MRERPRQRRQSLSRPATTQFIPHVPQDSPRSDLRNVFLFPPPHRDDTAPDPAAAVAAPPPSHIHRLRLLLCGCAAVRLCATPAGSSCRFPHGSCLTIGTSSLSDPIAAAGHHHTRLPRHLPTTAHRIHHRAHKKRRRSRNSSVPKSCVSCSTPYRSACRHHKVISIPG